MSLAPPTSVPRAAPVRIAGPVVLRPAPTQTCRVSGWVKTFTWCNLAAVALAFLLLCVVSERWWFSAVLSYLPRQLYALPSIVLLPASLVTSRRIAWVNAVALLVVVGPIMGLTMPVGTASEATAEPLRIASGNLQQGQGSLRKLLLEIEAFEPDVMIFQEAAQGTEPFLETYAGWEAVHLQSFLILSRYPLRVVDHCRSPAFQRWTAILVEVETPSGPVRIGDVHLMTPRHGASGLTVLSPLTGEGVEEFEWHQRLRDDEAAQTRKFFDQHAGPPLLIAGDFNLPSTSSLFTEHWSGFQIAFEAAGWGFGYTSPCNASRKWLANTPWMRIDHVLADDRWVVQSCQIGESDGSDHRLLFTEAAVRTQPKR